MEKIKNGPAVDVPEDHLPTVTGNVAAVWRISDRFTPGDIDTLIAAYLAGSTVKQLAEQYRIGTTTVKRLLKKRGARKTTARADVRA